MYYPPSLLIFHNGLFIRVTSESSPFRIKLRGAGRRTSGPPWARHGAKEFMSKSTIALIITWVIIGLVGAFLGGYFWAKKNVCSINNQDSNVMIDNKGSTTSTSDSSNSGTKTVVQPIEQK